MTLSLGVPGSYGARAGPVCRNRPVILGFLGSSGEIRIELGGQRRHRCGLELAHPLAGEPELLADRLERRSLAVEAEAQLEHAALPLGQLLQRLANLEPA